MQFTQAEVALPSLMWDTALRSWASKEQLIQKVPNPAFTLVCRGQKGKGAFDRCLYPD